MAVQLIMPKMGLSMETGTVGKWLRHEGESVNKGDGIVEIMTDKINNIVEAPASGVLLQVIAKEGEVLPIGAVLGFIGEAGERIDWPGTGASKASEAEQTVGERVKISPVARKLAEEHGIDYTRLNGSGPAGRITKEDVEKVIGEGGASAAAPEATPIAAIPAGQPAPVVVPYSGLRRVIGDNMARSWAVAPKVDYHVSVDAAALLALRKSINDNCEDKVTVTDMLVKIAARALKKRPDINVSLDGDSIRKYSEPNIGVAVALDNGLVVPVVRDADAKPLSQISREIKELVTRAKAGQLSAEEMRGGTFTITNIGGYNSVDWFTPIINQPEAAILGVGRTVEAPAVVEGQVVIRPMLGLSLSFDHRLIDGAPAAEFLGVLIKLIEKPLAVFV